MRERESKRERRNTIERKRWMNVCMDGWMGG